MATASPNKDIKAILKPYQEAFENELEDLLDEDICESSNELLGLDIEFPDQNLLESIKYSVLDGGKRLRPILSLLTAEAVLNKESLELQDNPALGLALAIELVHSGSLIHDDLPCMDDDDLRRSKPSNHKKFDEATALLAGDFLMTYPIEVLNKKTMDFYKSVLENDQGKDIAQDLLLNINQAMLKLSQAIQGMIVGQALDMSLTNSKSADMDALKVMEKLKTGALLVASVEISALISGAEAEQIQALKKYAENIGLAFQITDDILDCTASTEDLGKTSGKDQDQNKLTYVQKYGLEKAREIAASLIAESKDILKTAGLYSDKLELIAQYVISRNN